MKAERHTRRQAEVILMVAQGLTNKAIAEHLGIDPNTVEARLHRVYERLGFDPELNQRVCLATWYVRQQEPDLRILQEHLT
jgi:DNA-binding NarL/FixJ family response regulator